jgi:hypothetical protein
VSTRPLPDGRGSVGRAGAPPPRLWRTPACVDAITGNFKHPRVARGLLTRQRPMANTKNPKSRKPHDAIFKDVFSQPDNARGVLQSVLSAELVAAIDWSTLKLEAGHYVDSKLASSQSDVLYSASLCDGTPALVYCLFEHQSKSDPLMPLRLLKYMTRIWDRWLAGRRSRPDRLPAIIPVVMSHAQGGWSAATSMHELFDPRVVRPTSSGCFGPADG